MNMMQVSAEVLQDAVIDVLEQAADLIETVGWTQGSRRKHDYGITGGITGYCAIGAMQAVNESLWITAEEVFKDWLTSSWPKSMLYLRYVARWNDFPGRTAAEVIDAMKSCAKDLRNEAVPS